MSDRKIINGSRPLIMFGNKDNHRNFFKKLDISVNSKLLMLSPNSTVSYTEDIVETYLEVYQVMRASKIDKTPLTFNRIGSCKRGKLDINFNLKTYNFDKAKAFVGIMVRNSQNDRMIAVDT